MISATINDRFNRLVFTADDEGKEDLAEYLAKGYYEASQENFHFTPIT